MATIQSLSADLKLSEASVRRYIKGAEAEAGKAFGRVINGVRTFGKAEEAKILKMLPKKQVTK